MAKLNLRNKLNCTIHNGCECTHPGKLNPRNGKDQPSAMLSSAGVAASPCLYLQPLRGRGRESLVYE